MNISLSHIYFNQAFVPTNVVSSCAYWNQQGDCSEYKYLEFCKK